MDDARFLNATVSQFAELAQLTCVPIVVDGARPVVEDLPLLDAAETA